MSQAGGAPWLAAAVVIKRLGGKFLIHHAGEQLGCTRGARLVRLARMAVVFFTVAEEGVGGGGEILEVCVYHLLVVDIIGSPRGNVAVPMVLLSRPLLLVYFQAAVVTQLLYSSPVS